MNPWSWLALILGMALAILDHVRMTKSRHHVAKATEKGQTN